MLKGLLKDAEAEGLKLAPFIGVSCPGAIDADGSIEKGAQNLPGIGKAANSTCLRVLST
jgi:hypothetical protein